MSECVKRQECQDHIWDYSKKPIRCIVCDLIEVANA